MDWDTIPEADDPGDMPYGVAGDQMPYQVVESKPGDVLFFNQCLWHAAYNAYAGTAIHRAEVRRQPDDGWASRHAALVQ